MKLYKFIFVFNNFEDFAIFALCPSLLASSLMNYFKADPKYVLSQLCAEECVCKNYGHSLI